MYAALRVAVRPTYRTRPRFPLSTLPHSSRTFCATAIQLNTPPSPPDSSLPDVLPVQPVEQTAEVKKDGDVKTKATEKDDEVVSASNAANTPGWADKLKTSLGLEDKINSSSTPSPTTGGRLTPARLRKAQRARQEATSLRNELELPDWFAQRCVKLCELPPIPSPSLEGKRTGFNAEPNFRDRTPPPSTRVNADYHAFMEIAAITAGSFATVSAGGRNTFWGLKANLALYCAFDGGNTWLNSIVDRVARDQQADILRLDAQDIMELGGAFVSPDAQDFLSLRTLGFDAFQNEAHEEEEIDEDEVEEDEDDDPGAPMSEQMKSGTNVGFGFVLPPGVTLPDEIKKALPGIEEALKNSPFMAGLSNSPFKPASNSREKLVKKQRPIDNLDTPSSTPIDNRRLTVFWDTVIDKARSKRATNNPQEHKLIICIEDFMGISGTSVGEQLLESLANNIQRRRGEYGEKIMIVGTTSSSELAGDEDAPKELENESEGSFYRTLLITPDVLNTPPPPSPFKSWDSFWTENKRTRNAVTNLRNIQWMLRQIEPEGNSQDMSLIPSLEGFRGGNEKNDQKALFDQVLKQEDAHRIALIATGLRASELWTDFVLRGEGRPSTPALIRAAFSTTQHTRELRNILSGKSALPGSTHLSGAVTMGSTQPSKFTGFPTGPMPWNQNQEVVKKTPEEEKESNTSADIKARLEALKATCNRHEARLFGGIVHPDSIKTSFTDVHVAKDTVDAVRTLTSLSLLRPDAFKYGVLATNNISGLLLYGPPGTGKTLLAKAVAKESGATVLTVSGSDVNQMYVGESEKTVKAIFSLARKLAPCVIFIDEADSILGARHSKNSGRPSHRDTINQLLLEWDGLDSKGVFLMASTNRPFDLDDAVLRRLPRRVLVDLPTKSDREAILEIHLKNESLDADVSIASLAEQTPYYSGSDLKNIAVSAAMSCIKEENEKKGEAEERGETDFVFAERRILGKRHFDVAVGEIAASINADMSSLKDVRKFDEQYGDRKGRKKKNAFGFLEEVKKEESARVRG